MTQNDFTALDAAYAFDYKTSQHYQWKEDCQFQRGHRVREYVVSSVGGHPENRGLAGASYWRYETQVFYSSRDLVCEGKCCPTGCYADREGSELIVGYWQLEHVAELMHYAFTRALQNFVFTFVAKGKF